MTSDSARAGAGNHVTFAEVFALREYRALWASQLLSLVGDQLAVVALTWIVFTTSDSVLLTAITYSLSLLPWLIGGTLLAGLADRLPRREVMVWCDVVRAGLVVAMAIPGAPIWLLCVLLFTTELLSGPHDAARAALLPDVLAGDRYVLGTAIGSITHQVGQAFGFVVAGLLVSLFDPSASLLLNAATFLVGAALVRRGVRERPAARGEGATPAHLLADMVAGARLIARSPVLRTLTGLALVYVFVVVPEGIAVPYATDLGGNATAVGLLLAATPCGGVLGSLLFSRWVSPGTRLRLMGPLAVASCVPLIGCAAQVGLAWPITLLAVSGAASAYQVAANAAFVAAVPSQARGQAFGLVQSLMVAGQGLSIIAAGAAAQFWDPGLVIAAAGALGCLLAAALAVAWARISAGVR